MRWYLRSLPAPWHLGQLVSFLAFMLMPCSEITHTPTQRAAEIRRAIDAKIFKSGSSEVHFELILFGGSLLLFQLLQLVILHLFGGLRMEAFKHFAQFLAST